jgi:hypothetical protein
VTTSFNGTAATKTGDSKKNNKEVFEKIDKLMGKANNTLVPSLELGMI